MRISKTWKAVGAGTLVLMFHTACTRPVEFADPTPLMEILPENIHADGQTRHPVSLMFGEFQDLLLFHEDSQDWYHSTYLAGEFVESGEETVTWIEGVDWQALPSEVRGAWEAIAEWHETAEVDPNRRLAGSFSAFMSIHAWTREDLELLLDGAGDKEEVLLVLAHVAQLMWEEGGFMGTDPFVAHLWRTLMSSPYFTAEQLTRARELYPLNREASLQRTIWLVADSIDFFQAGKYKEYPDQYSREEIERAASESHRMVEILTAGPPFLEDDIVFLRSTLLFERTKYHSYFLDTEIDLPWATEDPWVVPSTTGLHYAQLPTTTDYYAPFRAKVWDQEQWVTGTGFLGIDEQGTRHLIFHPRDLKMDDTLIEVDGERIRLELQLASERVLLAITNRPEGSAIALGSLTSSEVPPEGWDRDFAWPWRVWPSSPDIPMDFDLETGEWRLRLPHADGEDLVIFEQGGPWADRPEDAIPVFAEPEPGRFTRDGVELVAPYWNLHVKH